MTSMPSSTPEVHSGATNEQRGCFTALPAEVQAQIWRHVDADSLTILPIAKCMLHGQRTVIYGHIKASHTLFAGLVGALCRQPALQDYCHSLTVEGRYYWPEEKITKDLIIALLFEVMPDLKSLVLHQCLDFFTFMLDHPEANLGLQKLTSLTVVLEAPKPHEMKFWDAARLNNLVNFPELRTLRLELDYLDYRRTPEPFHSNDALAIPWGPSITSFTLRCCKYAGYFSQLIQAMPSLERLSLEDYTHQNNHLVATLSACPTTLVYLSVKTSFYRGADESAEPIDSAFARFTHLEELHLNSALFTLDLFKYLRHPLKHLAFTGTHLESLSHDKLNNLLDFDSPSGISSLETIVLDVVESSVGNTTARHGLNGHGKPLLSGWRRPRWLYGQFDMWGLVNLLEFARYWNKVEITGSAIEALWVEDRIAEEERKAALMWEAYISA